MLKLRKLVSVFIIMTVLVSSFQLFLQAFPKDNFSAGAASAEISASDAVYYSVPLKNEEWSGYRSFGTITAPQHAIYASAYAITSLSVNVILENSRASGIPKVYMSSELNGTYDLINTDVVTVAPFENSGWGSSYCKLNATFSEGQNYKFIKIELPVTVFIYQVPSYKSINVVTVDPPSTYSGRISASSVYSSTYPVVNRSGAWDMNAQSGSMIYQSPYALTDVDINLIKGTTGVWGSYDIKVEASSNNTDYISVFPLKLKGGSHNPGWGSYYYDYKFSFAASQGIQYIKITITDCVTGNSAVILPGLNYLDINTVPIPNDYKIEIAPNENISYSASSDLSLRPENTGWNFGPEAGTATYQLEYPIKDIAFIHLSSNNNIGALKYYVSSDNVNFIEIIPINIRLPRELNPSWAAGEYISKAGFTEESNIKYVKVAFPANTFPNNLIPSLESIKVNPYLEDILPTGYQTIKYDFSNSVSKGTLNSKTMIFNSNGANATAIGGMTGFANAYGDGSLLFETIKLNNFVTQINLDPSVKDTAVIKAYISGEQNGTYTELPLARRKSLIQPTAWSSYEYYPADSAAIGSGKHYVKLEVSSAAKYTVQIMSFEFSYGQLNDEPLYQFESVNGGKSEYTYSYSAGSEKGIESKTNFALTRNGSNEEQIGGATGLLYSGSTGTLVFQTENLYNFNFTVNIGDAENLSVKAYVSASANGTYTEIPLTRAMNPLRPKVWNSYIYSPSDVTTIGTGKNFVKIEVSGKPDQIELMNLNYFYEDTTAPADPNLPSEGTAFSDGSMLNVMLKENFTLTGNSTQNIDFIGGNQGYVLFASTTGSVTMFSGNVKDFIAKINFPTINHVLIRAYVSDTIFGNYSEIKLTKYRNTDKPTGWESYYFRPENAADIPAGSMYVRFDIIGDAYNLQFMNYKYFATEIVAAPAPPDALGDGTVITDISPAANIKSYNYIKGNLTSYIEANNMDFTANSPVNADYIGVRAALINKESAGYVIYQTGGIKKLWFRLNTLADMDKVVVKAFVAKENTEGEYIEIPLERNLSSRQPMGFKSYIYSMPEGQEIPDGYNFLKIYQDPAGLIYINEKGEEVKPFASFQISGFDYEYKYIYDTPLPEFQSPAAGQSEMIDRLEGLRLTEDGDGKIFEISQVDWIVYYLGGDNGADRVIMKENEYADGYVIYKKYGMQSFDVRGYMSRNTTAEMEFYVSSDNENWERVEGITLTTCKLPDGPSQMSYKSTNLPAGANYLKILIPTLDSTGEMVISDVQILYSDGSNPGTGDNELMASLLALFAAFLGMSLISGIVYRSKKIRSAFLSDLR